MPSKKNKPTNSGRDKDFPPEKLTASDWAILKHVSLYHFTIRHAVQDLFFDSEVSKTDSAAKAGTSLDFLARHGYLKNKEDSQTSRTTKPGRSDKSQVFKVGGVKYYLLGNKSNLLAPMGFHFPKERLVPPKTEQSFYKHLAALWYCYFDGPRRYRLEQEEMAKLWTNTIPENRRVPHQPAYCLANEDQGPVVYRLYPTRKPKAAQIVEEVRKKLENDADNLGLQRWIDAGEYGYAVIVPSQDRKRDVERELAKSYKQRPLLASAKITVHQAPPPPLLAKSLRDRGDGSGGHGISAGQPTPSNPSQTANDLPKIDNRKKDEPEDLSFLHDTFGDGS